MILSFEHISDFTYHRIAKARRHAICILVYFNGKAIENQDKIDFIYQFQSNINIVI